MILLPHTMLADAEARCGRVLAAVRADRPLAAAGAGLQLFHRSHHAAPGRRYRRLLRAGGRSPLSCQGQRARLPEQHGLSGRRLRRSRPAAPPRASAQSAAAPPPRCLPSAPGRRRPDAASAPPAVSSSTSRCGASSPPCPAPAARRHPDCPRFPPSPPARRRATWGSDGWRPPPGAHRARSGACRRPTQQHRARQRRGQLTMDLALYHRRRQARGADQIAQISHRIGLHQFMRHRHARRQAVQIGAPPLQQGLPTPGRRRLGPGLRQHAPAAFPRQPGAQPLRLLQQNAQRQAQQQQTLSARATHRRLRQPAARHHTARLHPAPRRPSIPAARANAANQPAPPPAYHWVHRPYCRCFPNTSSFSVPTRHASASICGYDIFIENDCQLHFNENTQTAPHNEPAPASRAKAKPAPAEQVGG